MDATLRSVAAATGEAVADAGIATHVVALAEEVARGMLTAKSKVTAWLLVAVLMFAASAGLYCQQPDAGQDRP